MDVAGHPLRIERMRLYPTLYRTKVSTHPIPRDSGLWSLALAHSEGHDVNIAVAHESLTEKVDAMILEMSALTIHEISMNQLSYPRARILEPLGL